ncbi:hypothetical protein [Rhodocyclus tenuis]|uniref:hypothetical protein n=1 Tax=Rhodocyclus tenuis TaxID=1066 RepID=UPI00190301B2|nr:hypothetical protein [Rhodocyclus tenuis]MBK1680761.1 hypothetical protein [Rhodocyclus tenuis]
MSDHQKNWERFLDPDVLQPSLFSATIFITTFEILKNAIVYRVREFYLTEWYDDKEVASPDYEAHVLSRNRSPLYASLDWLLQQQAINEQDLATFEQLKKTRNIVAHSLFDVVTGQEASDHQAQLNSLIELLRKIEVWWVVNVELAINPECSDKEVDEASIVPGSILSLQMLIEVASGNTRLLEAWRKKQESMRSRS